MAGSRLEKIGTIFSRASGLLRTGVLKAEDKPLWYDIYAMHPPAEEPRFDRPAPNIQIEDIYYDEDLIRAKFHERVKQVGTVNLFDRKFKSQSQRFIELYTKFKAQGALDEEKIFEIALETLNNNNNSDRETKQAISEDANEEFSLSKSFVDAKSTKIDLKKLVGKST